MEEKKFNPQKLDRLNNPERLKDFPTEFVIRQTSLDNPDIIIDVGAGTGFFSIPFAEKFNTCTIYACDISDIMLDWMRENIVHKYSNIIPQKMDENKISLKDGIADFLFMVNLHHELESPEKMLQECYRLLKPKGSIAISDWRKEQSERGPSVELRYEQDEVVSQLEHAGFQSVQSFTQFPNNFLVIAKK